MRQIWRIYEECKRSGVRGTVHGVRKYFRCLSTFLGGGSTIQYTEEQNDVYEASSDAEGMREDKALVRYRIDIWNNHSTSEAALQVDEAMKVTGLKRIACADVPDPSGMKHKQMRYEGIIDMDSDSVYWR